MRRVAVLLTFLTFAAWVTLRQNEATPAKAVTGGFVVAWGDNTWGQTDVPAGLIDVKAVSGSLDQLLSHSLALRDNGTVVAWGDNSAGQLNVPAGLTNVTAVSAGGRHSLALRGDGTVVGWGADEWGQVSGPAGATGVTAVGAGRDFSIVLTTDGTVSIWGEPGSSVVADLPPGLSSVTAIAAGDHTVVALLADTTVVAWGHGTDCEACVPPGLTGVTSVAAGGFNGGALKSDGTVAWWGVSAPPPGLANVIALSAGGWSGLALLSNGTVTAWGGIEPPAGLSGVTAISAGGLHGLAVTTGYTPPPPFAPTNPASADPKYPVGHGGDPVNMASGGYSYSTTDVAISGRGRPLEFSRTYRTGSGYQGALGKGWSHNYDQRLVLSGGIVDVYYGEGHARRFTAQASGWTPEAWIEDTLVENIDGTFTLTTVDQLRSVFDSSGKLTELLDRNDNTTTIAYDVNGRIATATAPGGRQLVFTPDVNGRISRVTDPLGRYVEFTYNGAGELATVRNLVAGVTSFTYVPAGMATFTDANSKLQLQNFFDADGRVAKQVDGTTGVMCIYYGYGAPNPFGASGCPAVSPAPTSRQTVLVDQRGNKTTYDFDAFWRTTKVTDAISGITAYTYDSENRPLVVTDPLGHATTSTYDARGNVLTRKNHLNHTWTYTYNAFNDVLTSTDALGGTTTNVYDTRGNLTSSTDANTPAGVTTLVPDPVTGQVTSMTDARSKTTTYGYDAHGQRTSMVIPGALPAAQRTWTYGFDAVGRPTTVTDPLSHTTTSAYNDVARTQTVTTHLGHATTSAFDPKGNLLSVQDANGKVTSHTYDAMDRLKTTTDPLTQVTTNSYDLAGNLTSVVNVRGKTTSYEFDALNRRTSVTDPLTRATTFAYDAASRLTQRTDARGLITKYLYDDADRLTTVEYRTAADVLQSTVVYTYDDAGNRLTMTDPNGVTNYAYDALNRPTSITQPGSPAKTVSYQYDAVGNRTKLTYPDGKFVDYTYDDPGSLATVVDRTTATPFTTSYAYDNARRLSTTTYPNGVVATNGFDNADRLTSVTNAKGATFSSFTYTVDPVGNRTQLVAAGAGAGTHTYGLDNLYRLTSAAYPGGPTDSYTYDEIGNRLTKGATAYTYDDADQMNTAGGVAYTYDLNGNQITRGADTFTYDHENRLTQSVEGGTSSSSVYYGNGVRRSHTVGAATTTYVYDGAVKLPTVLQDGTNTLVYGLDLISMTDGAGNRTYFSYDGLGSTTDLTDGAGVVTDTYSYDVFGAVRVRTGSTANVWKFTGEQSDEFSTAGSSGTEALALDAVVTATNLTGATVANLDENPDAPDALWATATTTAGTALRVGFPTPAAGISTGANLQEFRVLLRKNAAAGGTPTYNIELWETGGAARLALLASAVQVTSTTGVVASVTWDASLLTQSNGSAVEVRIVGNSAGSGGNRRTVEVGAVRWNARKATAQREALNAVVSSTNFTGATVTNLQDDPDSADALWATATTVANDEVRVGFANPTKNPLPGANVQEFRVLLRKNAAAGGNPTYSLELWETGGGARLAQLANNVSVTSATGVVVSARWDASLLTQATGANVELRIIGTTGGSGGNRRALEVGAVEWNAQLDASTSASSGGLYFLRARHYDPSTGRFASKDPIEFAQRYSYAGGNPVLYVDPSGRCFGKLADLCADAARLAQNAPVSAAAYVWGEAWGGDCGIDSDLFVVCRGMSGGYSRGGTTFGNVFLTGQTQIQPDLLVHEKRHATQWATLGPVGFPVAYLVSEGIGGVLPGPSYCWNVFERDAGLHDGGYKCSSAAAGAAPPYGGIAKPSLSSSGPARTSSGSARE